MMAAVLHTGVVVLPSPVVLNYLEVYVSRQLVGLHENLFISPTRSATVRRGRGRSTVAGVVRVQVSRG